MSREPKSRRNSIRDSETLTKEEAGQPGDPVAGVKGVPELFKTLMDLAPEGIVLHRAFRIVYANASMAQILGASKPEEFIGLNYLMLNAPEYRDSIIERIEQSKKTGGANPPAGRQAQRQVIRMDGSRAWIEAAGITIQMEGEDTSLVFVRDISDRKRTEFEKEVLGEIGRLIGATLEINGVYEPICAEVQKLIPYDRICVIRIDANLGSATLVYARGLETERKIGDTRPLVGSLVQELTRTGCGFILNEDTLYKLAERFPLAVEGYKKSGIRSILTVPLIIDGKVIGGLGFRSLRPFAYSSRDLKTAQQVANALASAIANAELHSSLKRQEQENAIMAEIGRIVSSSLDIEEVYERFSQEAAKLIHFDRLSVSVNDPVLEMVRVAYLSGDNLSDKLKGEAFPLSGTFNEDHIRSGKGIIFHASSLSAVIDHYPVLQKSYTAGARSFMSAPLISQGVVIGALNFRTRRPKAYSDEQLHLAERIAEQISGCIANSELYADLKKTRDALENSESRLKTIFDSVPAIIFLKGRDNRLLNINRAGLQAFGLKAEAVIGRDISEVFDKAVSARWDQDDLEVVRSGRPMWNREQEFLTKDGMRYFMTSKVPVSDRSGLIIGILGFSQEVTEKRRIELALQASEERFKALFEQAGDHAFICNPNIDKGKMVIVDVNESACRELGYSREELIGMSITDLSTTKWSGAAVEKIKKEFKTGKPMHFEDWHRRKDGTLYPVEVLAKEVRMKGNDPLIFSIERNITRRKELEAELKSTLDRLESRVQERTLELQETNTALGVLLKKRENDRKELEEALKVNVDQLIMPFLDKLRLEKTDRNRIAYLNVLETNLKHIVSPFLKNLSKDHKGLTPKEIQISELIRQGKNSKEIAELFGLSVGTIITHRNNIRKKMNLRSQKINLRAHLNSAT